jgi:hypothetical protein
MHYKNLAANSVSIRDWLEATKKISISSHVQPSFPAARQEPRAFEDVPQEEKEEEAAQKSG